MNQTIGPPLMSHTIDDADISGMMIPQIDADEAKIIGNN